MPVFFGLFVSETGRKNPRKEIMWLRKISFRNMLPEPAQTKVAATLLGIGDLWDMFV